MGYASVATNNSPKVTNVIKQLLDITLINAYKLDEEEASLIMMIGAQNSGVPGWRAMTTHDILVGQHVQILIDSGYRRDVVGFLPRGMPMVVDYWWRCARQRTRW
jgi:hypothetical protein